MMIYKHLGSEIFDVVLEPHTITGSATRHTDLILKSLNFPKKTVKIPQVFSFLIKMLGLSITLAETLSKRRKIFV